MNPEKAPEVRRDLKDMTDEELFLFKRDLGSKLDDLLIEYQACEEELDMRSDWVSKS